MKKLKQLWAVLVVAAIATTFQMAEVEASSSLTKGTTTVVCGGTTTTEKASCEKAKTLSTKIEAVVKTFTGLVGAFAVGMIVYGGFKYITSQGDPKAAEGAKNIIWYSGVGLFIVLVAFIIFDLLAGAMV